MISIQSADTLSLSHRTKSGCVERDRFYEHKGIFAAYLTPGGAYVRKYKFVACIRPRPNGDDTYDSESFDELITRASNASWGIPGLEQSQVALDAWNRLRGRILSRGWHEVKTTDSNWYHRYSYGARLELERLIIVAGLHRRPILSGKYHLSSLE